MVQLFQESEMKPSMSAEFWKLTTMRQNMLAKSHQERFKLFHCKLFLIHGNPIHVINYHNLFDE